MFKRFYTPTPDEIHVNLMCEVMPIGDADQQWTKHMITRADIEIRLKFIEQIRIQHLHREDFESMGITCERAPNGVGNNNEAYICEAHIQHPRHKEPVKLTIYFAPSTNWTMITISRHVCFAGTTMNITELKKTLKRLLADVIVPK